MVIQFFLSFYGFLVWVPLSNVIDSVPFRPEFLVPDCKPEWNTFCSTSDESSANFGLFQAFRSVSGNFGRNSNSAGMNFGFLFPF